MLIAILTVFIACDYEVIPDETSLPVQNEGPTACFKASTTQCNETPCLVTFETDCFNSSGAQHFWYLNNNNISENEDLNQRKITYTYTEPGEYNATLIVFDAQGGSDTATISINVLKPLKACFTANAEVCIVDNCNVIFNAECAEPHIDIINYEWDFDANGTIDETGPDKKEAPYQYTKVGAYSVKLIITNSIKKKDSIILNNYIQVNETGSLVANFNTNNTKAKDDGKNCNEVCYDNTCAVKFDASNSLSSDANDIFYAWDFNGSGTIVSGSENSKIVEFEYTSPGIYMAKLTLSNSKGEIDEKTTTIKIREKRSSNFTQSNIDCTLPNCTISFIANENNNSYAYNWDFGDGNTLLGSSPNENHAYQNAGAYNASLIVTDEKGCAAEKYTHPNKIVIQERILLTADFTTNNEKNVNDGKNCSDVCYDNTCDVKFNASNNPSNPATAVYDWYSGNTKLGTGKTLDYRFENTGTYNVTLRVSDANSSEPITSPSQTIEIREKLTADFEEITIGIGDRLCDIEICRVNFRNNSTPLENIETYTWDFGDGPTEVFQRSELENENIFYNNYELEGDFNVMLTVKDDKGCSSESLVMKVEDISLDNNNVCGELFAAFEHDELCAFTQLNCIVFFDASLSSPQNEITSYEWTIQSDVPLTQIERGSGRLFEINLDIGVYRVRLTVKNECGDVLVYEDPIFKVGL